MRLTIDDQQHALRLLAIPYTRLMGGDGDEITQHWMEAGRTGPADEAEMQNALDSAPAETTPVPIEDQIAALETTIAEIQARLDSVGALTPVDPEVQALRDALVNGKQ